MRSPQLRCWWVEEDNAAVIQRMYYRAMPFPWNWIVPRQLKADAEARTSHFKAQGPTEYTHEVREFFEPIRSCIGGTYSRPHPPICPSVPT